MGLTYLLKISTIILYVESTLGNLRIYDPSLQICNRIQTSTLKHSCPNFILAIVKANIRDIVWTSWHPQCDMERCTRASCVTFSAITLRQIHSHRATRKCVAKDGTLWVHTSWKSMLFKVTASLLELNLT